MIRDTEGFADYSPTQRPCRRLDPRWRFAALTLTTTLMKRVHPQQNRLARVGYIEFSRRTPHRAAGPAEWF
jgi:hypothetical protein